MLVTLDHRRALPPAAGRNRHRHELLRKAPRLVRVDRPLVGEKRQLVLLGAADAVVAAHVLGCLEHAARNRVVHAPCGHARAHQAIVEHRPARPRAPAQPCRVELHLAHALRAAGQHKVGGAGLHLHARLDHRLETRAAAAVDLDPGHLDWEPRVERRDAPERRRIAVGVALAEQHVVDLLDGKLRPLDDRRDHGGGQPCRRDVAEHAAEAPHRGAQGLADDRISHPAVNVCEPPDHGRELAGIDLVAGLGFVVGDVEPAVAQQLDRALRERHVDDGIVPAVGDEHARA